jgi:hypothetical protein
VKNSDEFLTYCIAQPTNGASVPAKYLDVCTRVSNQNTTHM